MREGGSGHVVKIADLGVARRVGEQEVQGSGSGPAGLHVCRRSLWLCMSVRIPWIFGLAFKWGGGQRQQERRRKATYRISGKNGCRIIFEKNNCCRTSLIFSLYRRWKKSTPIKFWQSCRIFFIIIKYIFYLVEFLVPRFKLLATQLEFKTGNCF